MCVQAVRTITTSRHYKQLARAADFAISELGVALRLCERWETRRQQQQQQQDGRGELGPPTAGIQSVRLTLPAGGRPGQQLRAWRGSDPYTGEDNLIVPPNGVPGPVGG
jgi:hypothetical protein